MGVGAYSLGAYSLRACSVSAAALGSPNPLMGLGADSPGAYILGANSALATDLGSPNALTGLGAPTVWGRTVWGPTVAQRPIRDLATHSPVPFAHSHSEPQRLWLRAVLRSANLLSRLNDAPSQQ